MRSSNPVLLNAVANSGTQTGSAVPIANTVSGSFQGVFSSGTAAGTLSIQVSNDAQVNLPANEAPQNWIDIISLPVTSGAQQLVTIASLNYQYCRGKWVSSSGSGTVTLTASMQGF